MKDDDVKRSIVGVVVAYRSAETIGACVASLLTHGCEFVIVVDNAADPYTELAVKEAGPRARYYAQKTNLGFAAGCNVGVGLLPSSPGQWLAFVNPDVWIYAELEHVLDRPLRTTHDEPRPGDVRDSQANNSRLQQLFPTAEAIPLRAGLRSTVDWFRQDGGLA